MHTANTQISPNPPSRINKHFKKKTLLGNSRKPSPHDKGTKLVTQRNEGPWPQAHTQLEFVGILGDQCTGAVSYWVLLVFCTWQRTQMKRVLSLQQVSVHRAQVLFSPGNPSAHSISSSTRRDSRHICTACVMVPSVRRVARGNEEETSVPLCTHMHLVCATMSAHAWVRIWSHEDKRDIFMRPVEARQPLCSMRRHLGGPPGVLPAGRSTLPSACPQSQHPWGF